MLKKLKIKKGSTVEVITGGDKGRKGAVLFVDPVKMKIKVQGVKMLTHFDKEKGQFTQEGFIDYSNVKLVEAAQPKKAKAKSKKASARA